MHKKKYLTARKLSGNISLALAGNRRAAKRCGSIART